MRTMGTGAMPIKMRTLGIGVMPMSTSSTLGPHSLPNEYENLFRTLQDSTQRDDLKLKALQELWTSYEFMQSSANYHNYLESIVKITVSVLSQTSPQFIAQNNTHELRKLLLEFILRSVTHDIVRANSKDLVRVLLRLINIDNEVNALLALRIITDLGKNTKIHLSTEMASFIAYLKQIVKDMQLHIRVMFENRDLSQLKSSQSADENYIEALLPHCFHIQPINLNPGTSEIKYNLIPRASQSVKFIQDLPMFFVWCYQMFKTSVTNECMEFIQICLDYCNLIVPQEAVDSGLQKGLVDEFFLSQGKCINFISIMGKVPQFLDCIIANGDLLVSGLMAVLTHVPSYLIVVRRDVLMCLKFCFSTDLKNKFVPFLPRLLSEEFLLGTSPAANEHLWILVFQMMADLVHNMRQSLTYSQILFATSIFTKQLNDNSLTYQTQIMCVRLMNSICETTTKHETQGEPTRDLLLIILETLALKLKRFCVYNLPQLKKQHGMIKLPSITEKKDGEKSEATTSNSANLTITPKTVMGENKDIALENVALRKCSLDTVGELDAINEEEFQSSLAQRLPAPTKIGKCSSPSAIMNNLMNVTYPPMNISEARNMVKFLLNSIKFCVLQLMNTKRSNFTISKISERDIFERLVKYGVMSMDVYLLPYHQQMPRMAHGVPRQREENKDIMESLGSIFTSIDSDVFREIFVKYIEFIIERMPGNNLLNMVVNTLFLRPDWTSKFGVIMLKYLMERLPYLSIHSVSNERTSLYMKLFKYLFTAIGCANPQASPDGEQMLQPYLGDLIRKCTEYALTAREPLNYFLLLRALFRSIGGGSHDILYTQFLPLLPNLLQFLNKLQSCQHRQQMRELFLELCLTVPVRLSSLLPYLPLLMDPLVCALNGSSPLVQQGLRTLELCVDNLQPEYLFEHMAPVRAHLMQGLWKVLSSSSEIGSAVSAFRILGKFGGCNRRMLCEPQVLKSISDSEIMPSIVHLPLAYRGDCNLPCVAGDLTLSELMKMAVDMMSCSIGELPPVLPNGLPNLNLIAVKAELTNIRSYCMEIVKCVLLSSLSPVGENEDWESSVFDCVKENTKSLDSAHLSAPVYRCLQEADRKMYTNALVVLFIGVVGKDLRPTYLKFFNSVVRQLTLNSLLELIGRDNILKDQYSPLCMDSCILVDAIVAVLSDSNKDFVHAAVVAMCHISETYRLLVDNDKKIAKLPLIRYLIEQISSLCYGPSWFCRLGGASGLKYIVDNLPFSVVDTYLSRITESLCEVIIGLQDQLSSGAIELAMTTLLCLHDSLRSHSLEDRNKVAAIFMEHYIILLFYSSLSVHEIAMRLITSLSASLSLPISELFDLQTDFIKKQIDNVWFGLLGMSMSSQTVSLAILNSIIEKIPVLLDSINEEQIYTFLEVVLNLCENPVDTLMERQIYKMAEKCPAHFLPPYPVRRQMETLRAYAMKLSISIYKFLSGKQSVSDAIDWNQRINQYIRRVLDCSLKELLGSNEDVISFVRESLLYYSPIPENHISLFSTDVCKRICSATFSSEDVKCFFELYNLNNTIFTKEIADALLGYINGLQVLPASDNKDDIPHRSKEDCEAVILIMKLMMHSELSDFAVAKAMFFFACFFEENYCIDIPLDWVALIAPFLSRWPSTATQFLLSFDVLNSTTRSTMMRRVFGHKDGQVIREGLYANPGYFAELLKGKSMDASETWVDFNPTGVTGEENEYTIFRLLDDLSTMDSDWFSKQSAVIANLHELWNSVDFKLRYSHKSPSGFQLDEERTLLQIDILPLVKYKVPHIILNIFVRYARTNMNNFDVLVAIVSIFDSSFATNTSHIKDFLEKEVIPSMSLNWRKDLFNFILDRLESNPKFWVNDASMINSIRYLLIPCLHWAFERYEVDEVLGTALVQQDLQNDEDPRSPVYRMSQVIEKERASMTEQNTIVFYKLCLLLVDKAPQHIHNNACKRQGNRLRTFMLFAWPCLTQTTAVCNDASVRFTGFLFLAHIIDKFTINRKICLQVFHALVGLYTFDSRDLIKQALDIVISAIPVRMEDGHIQMLSTVKKILFEEGHNLAYVQHIINAVTRNYRVFYAVRHELVPALLGIMQRVLHSVSGLIDGIASRRLFMDICELCLKWDLLRQRLNDQKKTSQQIEASDVTEVDALLRTLENETGDKSEATAAQIGKLRGSREKEEPIDDALNYKPIGKDHTDQMVSVLMKFACAVVPQPQPGQYTNSTQEIAKRCCGLLRAAVKADVWGSRLQVKVNWIEKQLIIAPETLAMRHDNANAQNANNCIKQAEHTLEILLMLTPLMPKNLVLHVFKPLQRAIISCLNSNCTGLVKTVNLLVSKLCEVSKTSVSGLDDFDIFNQYMGKYVNEQFSAYYKSSGHIQQVLTSMSLLRAIVTTQPSYLENMCLQGFLKVFEKSARDHANSHGYGYGDKDVAGDLASICMEMLESRVQYLTIEHRRNLAQSVLLPLIDKSGYEKIHGNLIAITRKIVEAHGNAENAANPGYPLSVRLFNLFDRRNRTRNTNQTHLASYLQLVLMLFKDPAFRSSEYAERMEEAFYTGLTYQDGEIQSQFLQLWESEAGDNIHQRLRFVLRDQNWLLFRDVYWIRYVVWLFLRLIPASCSELIYRRTVYRDCASLWKTIETSSYARDSEPSLGAMNVDGVGITSDSSPRVRMETDSVESEPGDRSDQIINEQKALLRDSSSFNVRSFADPLCSLVLVTHDAKVVSAIFMRLFSSILAGLAPEDRNEIIDLIIPFLSSGVHNSHITARHSALNTWLDAVSMTMDSRFMPARLIKFIASKHHSWFRGVLLLETQALSFCPETMRNNDLAMQVITDSTTQEQLDILNSLAELYEELSEMDQFSAVWDRRALKQETVNIIHRMQAGEYKEAFINIEDSLKTVGEQMTLPLGSTHIGPAMDQEMELLFDLYAKCCEELMQWDNLRDYANSMHVQNPRLLMKAAEHLPDWNIMRDCVEQISGCVPPKFLNNYNMYNAMLQITGPEPTDPLCLQSKIRIEKALDEATHSQIQHWRTLPELVSNAHWKILQSAHMLRELYDVVELKVAMDTSGANFNSAIINEMKLIVKTWRNRPHARCDDMSFISSVYGWRCQIHSALLKKYEEWEHLGTAIPPGINTQQIVPIHSAAQGQVFIAQAAKRQRLYDLALDQLDKLHTIHVVPMMDAHLKVWDYLKTLKAQAEHPDASPKKKKDLLHLGLLLIDETSITDFNPDQISKLYSIKGTMLSLLDKKEEAQKMFSIAGHLLEQSTNPGFGSSNVFKAWGNHVDNVFHNERSEWSAVANGTSAVACFLEAARSETEDKAKKYIAKLMWTSKLMVSLGQASIERLDEQFEKHARSTVPDNWLTWIPQLISDIQFRPQSKIKLILDKIASTCPMSVFYALRCVIPPDVIEGAMKQAVTECEPPPVLASSSDWIKELYPMLLGTCKQRLCDVKAFNDFLSEIHQMKEYWSERQWRYANKCKREILRCLREQENVGIAERRLDESAKSVCRTWIGQLSPENDLFEKETYLEASMSSLPTTEHEFISKVTNKLQTDLTEENLSRQPLLALLDVVIQVSSELHKRLSLLPRKIPLPKCSEYLSSFNPRKACVEMPSDLLSIPHKTASFPDTEQYSSMIYRIDPYVEMMISADGVVRRMVIRSQYGKATTYHIRRTVECLPAIKREQQYLDSLNSLLQKEKESGKRHLSIHTPTQMVVSPYCSIMEVGMLSSQADQIAHQNQNSGNFIIRPLEVFANAISQICLCPDDVISLFYNRIQEVSRQTAFSECTTNQFVDCSILSRYLMQIYRDPTHFYMLRKQIARHIGVLSIVEHTSRLSPVMLSDIFIHRVSGQYFCPDYKFIVDSKEQQVVPFRLTPNLGYFLNFTLNGDVQWAAMSTAKCLLFRKPEVILRPFLWDTVIELCGGNQREAWEMTRSLVQQVVQNIKNLSSTNSSRCSMDNVSSLLLAARNLDNLANVDPAYHPWF